MLSGDAAGLDSLRALNQKAASHTLLPEEAFAGDYPQIVEYLIAHGAHLPKRIMEGSESVQEVLRRRGVPDGE